MTVGGVLNEAFDLYKRFFKQFFLVAAAVFVLLDLLTAIAADANSDQASVGGAFWSVVSIVVGIVGSLWVQGALIATVADVRDGRADDAIETTYGRVRPFLVTLFVAGILAGVGIAVGLIALVVPGLFLLTRWSVVTPVVVLEKLGAMDALRRSWELVRGNGWTVFGVVVVTLLLALLAHGVFAAVFLFLPDFLRNWIGGLIANSIVTPFIALAWTTMYFHLRGDPEPATP
jgi:hypothetical protein